MEDKITAYGNYLAGTEKADNTTALYIREAVAFIQYIGDKTVTKTLVMEYAFYLPDKLVKELEDYCREEGIRKGCIFTGRKGKPITCNGVYRMMQKIADMTGVPLEKAHPHSLRHLFALTYIDTYNNIGELADILGHSSLEITRIYLSSSREEKRNKMNRLNL